MPIYFFLLLILLNNVACSELEKDGLTIRSSHPSGEDQLCHLGIERRVVEENIDAWGEQATQLQMSIADFLITIGILPVLSDDSSDSLIAQLLEEDAKRDHGGGFGADADESLALALQLAGDRSLVNGYQKLLNLPDDYDAAARAKLGSILHQASMQTQEQDVHAANKAFFVPHWQQTVKAVFLDVLRADLVDADLKFKDFEAQFGVITVLPNINANVLAHFKEGMKKIEGYWGQAEVETAETTFYLAQWAICIARVTGASLETLYDGIAENTQTNGGCHAGVNGRLLRYIMLTFLGNLNAAGQIIMPS